MRSSLAIAAIAALSPLEAWAGGGRVTLESDEVCAPLAPLLSRANDRGDLPLGNETVRSESPEGWAGPPSGHCGPLRVWVVLDHVQSRSGSASITAHVQLHADAPLMVLGTAWPRVVRVEDEKGRPLDASPAPADNRVRMKTPSSNGSLDSLFSLTWAGRTAPERIEHLRAALPAVVVKGFRPMTTISDAFRDTSRTSSMHGVSVRIENAGHAETTYQGRIRVLFETRDAGDLWTAFTGVPVALVDSAGSVVYRRWVQNFGGEEGLHIDIGFTARPENKPPYALVVYEPDAVRIDVPISWESADVPPVRIEQAPVPP
ncbi:MAG: hypothetical protein U0166_23410 [Acidobacteriota bacterium]